MRMISVHKLTSGMQLAKPLLTPDGRVLLRENVALTDSYIRRIQSMAYTYVYIQDDETCDITAEDTVDEQLRIEVVRKIKQVFDKLSDPQEMRKYVYSGRLGQEFTKLFDTLYEHLKQSRTLVLNLSAIYASDAFLYTHCMNVALYAGILSIARGLSDRQTRQLGVGAMLHDIGKVQLPKALLDKPGPLTDEERAEIQKHCEFGYELLRKQTDLSLLSAHCALQHHERMDGKGYPRGLKGNEIHEFGRLLAVADVYDALTSNRVYRRAWLPHEAVEFLYSNTATHFDPVYVNLFRDHVNIYPPGMPVRLSNGCKGVVARANASHLQRPVILVLEEDGHPVSPYELDLVTHLNVVITGCEL